MPLTTTMPLARAASETMVRTSPLRTTRSAVGRSDSRAHPHRSAMRAAVSAADFMSIVGPDPLQDLRQQRAAVRVRVSAVAPEVLHLVTRTQRAVLVGLGIGVLECRQHLLVRQEPVAVFVGQIVLAIL